MQKHSWISLPISVYQSLPRLKLLKTNILQDAKVAKSYLEKPLHVRRPIKKGQRSIPEEIEDYRVIEFLLSDRRVITDAFHNIFMRFDLSPDDIHKEDIYYLREGGFKRVYKLTLGLKDSNERFSFLVKVVKPDVVKTDSGYYYDESYAAKIVAIARQARQRDLDLFPAIGGYYTAREKDNRQRIIFTEGLIPATSAALSPEKRSQLIITTYLMYYHIFQGEVFFEDPKPENIIIHRRPQLGYRGTLIDIDNVYYDRISPFQLVLNLVFHGFKGKDIIEAFYLFKKKHAEWRNED